MSLMSESNQRVHTRFGAYDDAAAVSAVTAARATAWNVLFSTKCHAAVAASTCYGFYLDSVDEHGRRSNLG
jgi:hypothetical protein